MWDIAQKHEKDWWGNCCNTLGEEMKQLVYAEKMGLKFIEKDGRPFIIDLEGKKVLDIGGGPCSLLLKTINSPLRVVIDPCEYPSWVEKRYIEAGIEFGQFTGEEIPEDIIQKFDEVWIYNVLQHVQDPEKVIQNAKRAGKVVRIFEWIDAETNEMHPHSLKELDLDKWLMPMQVVTDKTYTKGVEYLENIKGCTGNCYYGTF